MPDILENAVNAVKKGESFEATTKVYIKSSCYQLSGKDPWKGCSNDFGRSGDSVTINGVKHRVKHIFKYISSDRQDRVESQRTLYSKLDISDDFRDSIIINHFQGGPTFGHIAVLDYIFCASSLSELMPHRSSTTQEGNSTGDKKDCDSSSDKKVNLQQAEHSRKFSFKKIDENRVKAECSLLYDGFDTSSMSLLNSNKDECLKWKSEFDFVWEDGKISVDNVNLSLIPLGNFRKFVAKENLYKIYGPRFIASNVAIASSSMFSLAGLAIFTAFILDSHEKIKIDMLESNKKILTGFIFFVTCAGISFLLATLFYRGYQKNDYRDAIQEIDNGKIPRYIDKMIDRMSCDATFSAFKSYVYKKVSAKENPPESTVVAPTCGCAVEERVP